MEPRNEQGKFIPKSDAERKVRSIRATDRTWDDFGFLADQRRITRADLLELLASSGGGPPVAVPSGDPCGPGPVAVALAVEHLHQALTLKANAGGAIKAQIRAALELLK